jgi:transposase
MASAFMPDGYFEIVSHHLPPESIARPRGGRPPIAHRIVVGVLWYVLATGCRWQDVPPQMGCSGRTAHRRVKAWQQLGIWDRLHVDLLGLLRKADRLDPDLVVVDSVIVRAFGGGEATGPSPVDRGKSGSKHTVMVERHGVPLVIQTDGANASDHNQIFRIVVDFPKVAGKPGRPSMRLTRCMPIAATTAMRRGRFWPGWASNRTLPAETPNTAAAWARPVGWSNARSSGSKDSDGCVPAMIGCAKFRKPGPPSPPARFASDCSTTM